MADADVVGTDESVGQTRHWLVNGVTLKNGDFFLVFFFSFTRLTDWIYSTYYPGTSGLNVSTTDGVAVTDYAGPAPPAGSGPHR
jgi:hypothetical protein